MGTTVLFDANHFESIVSDEAWEEEFVDDVRSDARRTRAGHMAVLTSGCDGAFDVELRVEGSLTPAERACVATRRRSVFESKGAVFVGGLEFIRRTPARKAATPFDLAPGLWSVTTYGLEGEEPMPNCVALLARPGAEVDEAKQRAERNAARKIATQERRARAADACALAMRGEIDRAIPLLEAEAPRLASSRYALALIRAYRGDWAGVLDAAGPVLVDPGDTWMIERDVRWLVLRAARETGRWAQVSAFLRKTPRRGRIDLDDGEGGPRAIDAHLRKQAASKGALRDPPFWPPPRGSAAARKAAFAAWMQDFEPTNRPGDREDHAFSGAAIYGIDEVAMKTWPVIASRRLWTDAVVAARIFLRNRRRDEAWTILASRIGWFWTKERGQIAPLEPLVDRSLQPVLDPERLASLLEAPKNAKLPRP